jgi:hypothetical protein
MFMFMPRLSLAVCVCVCSASAGAWLLLAKFRRLLIHLSNVGPTRPIDARRWAGPEGEFRFALKKCNVSIIAHAIDVDAGKLELGRHAIEIKASEIKRKRRSGRTMT